MGSGLAMRKTTSSCSCQLNSLSSFLKFWALAASECVLLSSSLESSLPASEVVSMACVFSKADFLRSGFIGADLESGSRLGVSTFFLLVHAQSFGEIIRL